MIGLNLYGMIPKYQWGTSGIQNSNLDTLEELRKSNPNEYNRILIENARRNSPNSEIIRYIDADGNFKTTTNVGAGYVSGTDPVGLTIVEGAIMNKPLQWIGKGIWNGVRRLLPKGKITSSNSRYQIKPSKIDELELTKDRLRNGGFDRLKALTTNKLYEGRPLLNYNNFEEDMLKFLLEAKPIKGKASDFNTSPSSAAIANLQKKFYTEVFEDAPDKFQTPKINNILTAHEYSHLVYLPDWNNKVPLSVYNPPKHKSYLLDPRSGGLAEQTARGTLLKNYFRLKEGEEITPEMWEYAKLNYVQDTGVDNNMTDWFNGVRNIPEYLKWLNKNAPLIGMPIYFNGITNGRNNK